MFSNVFKTIQFYPKGGLTIQLWRTGRFVELDPTLRQSDGLAVELNWKQQSRDINLFIKGWFPDGIKGALNCICVDSEAILLEPIHSCFVVVNHLKILFCPADWQLGWVGLSQFHQPTCCFCYFKWTWLGWTMVDWHLWLIPVTLVNLGDSALSAHTTDMPQKIQKYTTLVGKAFFLNNIYFLCWIFLALNRVIRSSFLFLSFSFISPSLVAEKNSKKQPIILHH